MNNAKELTVAQKALSRLDKDDISSHDACDALFVILGCTHSGKTTWQELGTSYGECYGAMRLALIRETQVTISKLRDGFFEPRKADEKAREILGKSMFTMDEIDTTREELLKFLRATKDIKK